MNILKMPAKTFAEAQRIRMRMLAEGGPRTVTMYAINRIEHNTALEADVFLENIYKYRNEIAPTSNLKWDLESDIITATVPHQYWEILSNRYSDEERPWEKGDVVKYGHGVVKQFILEPMEVDDV